MPFEFVPQRGNTHGIFFQSCPSEFGRFAEAHDAGYVFRAGAKAALMVAAVEKLRKARAAANVESADSLGRVVLVAGHR